MVQFTYEDRCLARVVPKIAMEQDQLKDGVRKEARMIQRAYDYFQSNIKAGNLGLPNSRSIKPVYLRCARELQPVYKLEDCPGDDGEFPESWIKVSGALKNVLTDCFWYGNRLLKNPDEDLVSWLEHFQGKEILDREVKRWKDNIPLTLEELMDIKHERMMEYLRLFPRYEPLEFERVEYKPFATYQKFEKAVPYEPTKEELAETERVRKQSEACGTPSKQTARCYLFDLIDTSPSARETLEKQAREDPKAAYHIQLLKEKKAAADKAKKPESLSYSAEEEEATNVNEEIPTEVDDQKEMVRQMYSVGISDDNDNDKVFQMERGPWTVSQPRRFPKPVLTGCPTGILIDF
ncbi:hypothetical protein FVEN_g784 [Fusarium venenatum]|uniref:Uncharacterized protein n=1 Tax=Fusarium venenatum TaxID=56646 RepID=A0A2L2TQ61_9HYPO|nr:uncharacterized protein FVRRES_10810 [Fusarium venenatum]KAG8361179.1 hypothetical protein FVEN_g784 [Fusarium venenatum]KAH6967388.1 hypothetical protein EDB82DRAFT_481668 [Fusarium venenatum]CEI70733.1 unnamed protein product [Fusarium venenatum]